MVSTEETEDITLINFRQLADKLNLEQNVCTQAWNSYQQIRPKFDLEVRPYSIEISCEHENNLNL